MAWAYVNSTSGSAGGSNPALTTTWNITTGNRLFYAVHGSGTAVTSVADSAGNTYALIYSDSNLVIYAATITAGGGGTVTVTGTNTGGTSAAVILAEYSGVAGPVDVSVGTATATSNTPTSAATAATTGANELVIGVGTMIGANPTITGGTGYTLRTSFTLTTQYSIAWEDEDSGSSGTTQTASFALVTAEAGEVVCAAIKLAAPSSGIPTIRRVNQAVMRAAVT